jgi:hypothetical protein
MTYIATYNIFRADIDELIKSDSMDCVHKFRIDAIDTTLNKQYENESMEKRGILMDVVLRYTCVAFRVLVAAICANGFMF